MWSFGTLAFEGRRKGQMLEEWCGRRLPRFDGPWQPLAALLRSNPRGPN
jgi:hypothetical protein